MAIRLSAEVESLLYGDDAILKYLDVCKASFDAGDRTALFELIELCARFQAVIPEWAADEILVIRKQLEDGLTHDFNDAFGFKPPHRTKVKKEARLRELESKVKSALFHCRCNGHTFNSEDAFSIVAEKLNVSKRDVKAIYKRNPFLAKIPQKQPDNTIIGYGHMKSPPPPRRRGRGILKDD